MSFHKHFHKSLTNIDTTPVIEPPMSNKRKEAAGGGSQQGSRRVRARNNTHSETASEVNMDSEANNKEHSGDGQDQNIADTVVEAYLDELEHMDDEAMNSSLEEMEDLEKRYEDDYILVETTITQTTSVASSSNTAERRPLPDVPEPRSIRSLRTPLSPRRSSPSSSSDSSDYFDDSDDDDAWTYVKRMIVFVTPAEEKLYSIKPYSRYRVSRYSRLRMCWTPIKGYED